MASIAGILTSPFRKNCFRPAVVAEAHDINEQFRLVRVLGETLQESLWSRGHKVRFRLGEAMFRTHMPVHWDVRAGFAEFIFFLHGNGPGSAWAASLKKGDRCQLSVLKPCLNLAELKGRTIFFGDETSMGTALALGASAYARHEHTYVFEVSSRAYTEQVARQARLCNTAFIQKTAGHSHLTELTSVLLRLAQGLDLPRWVFTGCAQSIQRIRNQFGSHGLPLTNTIVKPYWAEGKAGLD